MKRFIMPVIIILLAALCVFMFLEVRSLQSRVEALEVKGVTVVTEHIPEEVAEYDIRADFSTLDEVRTYFDERFPELWMSAHFMSDEVDFLWLASGEEIMQRQEGEIAGRGCVANAATWLLSDDMEIYTLIGFRSSNGTGDPLWAMNCIKTDDGYEIIDPVLGMRGDEISRFGAMLPEAKVASLEEYVELLRADNEILANLDMLCLYEGGGQIEFYESRQGVASVKSPGEILFVNEEKTATAEKALEHIKPENIGNYALSALLGGTTLTPEETYSLLDAEPEVVRERVSTAADLLLYMLAAQTGDCHGCYCDEWDGYVWHTNLTAKDVMEQRLGNCGSCANLANYLLDGDYEEVGFINHAYYFGQGGGHVYNYILHEGQYYIVDYSSYIFSNYEDHDIPVLNRLEDFDANAVYGGVSLVIAYDTPGQHLPNIFGEDMGDPHYYVPTGSEYTVLYEAGDGYLIGEMPLDKKYHDYTVYWED